MFEEIMMSKTRVKLLKLFLTHIGDRYYLRELERMLNESLSPLRRQLVRLTKMGILMIEEEANLKYYRVNPAFAGIEELKKLVLGRGAVETIQRQTMPEPQAQPQAPQPAPIAVKRIKYDVAVLTVVALFVLLTASFVVYSSSRNIKHLTNLISEKGDVFETESHKANVRDSVSNTSVSSKPSRPDEMVSRRWKVLPGNYPALSSGETIEKKKSEEL